MRYIVSMSEKMTGNNNAAYVPDREDTGTNAHASPVGDTFIQLSDVDLSGHNTSIPSNVYIEGAPIKQNFIRKMTKHISRKVYIQIIQAFLRNLLVWCALVCGFILMVHAKDLGSWHIDRLVAVSVLFAMGLLGTGFHVARGYYDLTFRHPTLIGSMLRDAMPRDDFIRVIQNRQLSAPEIMLQVALRSGALSYEDPNHWTRRGRKTLRELNYSGWADQSKSVNNFRWPTGTRSSAWLLVIKDFRCVDEHTKTSLDADVAEFRKDSGYESNSYFMDFEYILNWKENDACPDVESILIFEDTRTIFHNMWFYRVSWFLALDAFYRMLFHLLTNRLEDYHIVKFIER